MISRPGRSQGLLYKQPFPPTALRRRHAQMVRVSTSSYKTDYVIVIKNFLNSKGRQNPIGSSKVMPILLQGQIWFLGLLAENPRHIINQKSPRQKIQLGISDLDNFCHSVSIRVLCSILLYCIYYLFSFHTVLHRWET